MILLALAIAGFAGAVAAGLAVVLWLCRNAVEYTNCW